MSPECGSLAPHWHDAPADGTLAYVDAPGATAAAERTLLADTRLRNGGGGSHQPMNNPRTTGVHACRTTCRRIEFGDARRAIMSRVLPWLLLAAAALVIVAIARRPAPSPPYGPATVRLTFVGPIPAAGAWFTIDPHDAPVVSPDGRLIALPLEAPEGKALYLRPLDSFDLIRVEGGGRRPFFSPDGGSVAFARVGSIWKMNLDDRQPALVGRLGEVLWDVGFASWHPDGRLLIPGLAGLWSMPASGGEATLLVASDASRLERFVAVAVLVTLPGFQRGGRSSRWEHARAEADDSPRIHSPITMRPPH